MSSSPTSAADPARVPAGHLPPWTLGDLPPAPAQGWRSWFLLLGPGVLLAGSSIGTGEWLFGPAVSAQYGGSLLWLAGLSIVGQVFCNLEMMRYAVYCGESIIVGYLRTWPGPRFWMLWYAILDLAAIWPYNASNAAVPLAAAVLGHLPGAGTVSIAGAVMSEPQVVKVLGYAIFLLAFVPLIFGGTIYKMLERVMTIKLVLVLGYLCFFAVFMVSGANAWEVISGFFRVGTVPLRAETIVVGRHFAVTRDIGQQRLTVKGTVERKLKDNVEYDSPLVTSYLVGPTTGEPERVEKYDALGEVPSNVQDDFKRLTAQAVALAQPNRFTIEDIDDGATISVRGRIDESRAWHAERFAVDEAGHSPRQFTRLDDVPEPFRGRFQELIENQGLQLVNVVGYFRQHGRLPPLDWAMLAAFAAIAGSGGLSNTLFSNFARDAGWGMGRFVGTIPSAIGGRKIQLSHVGEAFRLDAANRPRWRGWMRHVLRDQLAVWMLCSAVGMALPCMLSLEFIRHAPVSGDRVAAMTAEGMADRYPQFRQLLWSATLFCGFLVLAPGQILSGDMIARRWTDIIWTSNSRVQKLSGDRVRWIYYSILTLYGMWGLVALSLFDPLEIAKIGAVLMNIALGWSALHAVYVNRALLPAELQSNLFMQLGTIACGVFFLGISVIVFLTMWGPM
jgi:hypothetical protein